MTDRTRTSDRGGRGRDDREDSRPSRGRDDASADRSNRRGGSDRGSERGSSRGGSSSGFSYQRRSAEDVKAYADSAANDFDSYLAPHIKMFKPHDGYNTIRILPPTWDNPKHFGVPIHVHYGVGPDQQTYLCHQKMKNEPCPICEERDRARRAGEDEDYIKDLEPSRRTLFYLIDRDNEKDGVLAWPAPFSKIDQAIVKVSVDRKTSEVLPIDDPEEGYDIEFEKTGKGIGTQYGGVAIARRESPLGDSKWLDFAVDNPLPDVLEYFSYEHIQHVFGGSSAKGGKSSDRGDDRPSRDGRGAPKQDEDEAPRSSRSSRASPAKEPEYTWEGVHAMSSEELDALVDQERLDIDPNKAESDEQLADWICEDLKLEKAAPVSRRGRAPEPEEEEETPSSRLRSLRNSRRD